MKPPEPDAAFEVSLRPPMFSEFTGQRKVCERLELLVAAAKKRRDVLQHILLIGPPGLGKTTLANIIAREMDVNIKNTSGPVIEKAGELAGLLTSLEKGDVLFIDEIHRLQPTIEEYLYPAMEDYRLDIIIDQGPQARSLRLQLPKFTLIGATTRAGMVSAPLRSRFGMTRASIITVPKKCRKLSGVVRDCLMSRLMILVRRKSLLGHGERLELPTTCSGGCAIMFRSKLTEK